jgi:hypothetical protein
MDKGKLSRHFFAMTPKTPRFPPNASPIVEVLAYPSVKLLDVTGPIQVFATTSLEHCMTGSARIWPAIFRFQSLPGRPA